MNDSDDAPPMLEVVDYSNLVPCPPQTGPWPALHRLSCVGQCGTKLEVWVDRRTAASDDAGSGQAIAAGDDALELVARSASGIGAEPEDGWLLLRSEGRWVCGGCAAAALDFDDPEVREAVTRRDWWRAIRVVEQALAVSVQGWRRGQR